MEDYADVVNFHREVACFAVPNYGILSFTNSNSSGRVEFDFFTIWQKLNAIGIEHVPYVYMIHSHPPGMPKMSSTDHNMIHGWCQGLGIPICYIIVYEDGHTFYLCVRNGKTALREEINVDLDTGLKQTMMMTYCLSLHDQSLNEEQLEILSSNVSQLFDLEIMQLPMLTEGLL